MEPPNFSPPGLQAHLKRIWLHGFLAGFGVVLVLLLMAFFIWGWPGAAPDAPKPAAKPVASRDSAQPPTAPMPPPQTPPPPETAVNPLEVREGELRAVLGKLEEANQKKDLQQFMSLYSPTFPALAQHSQEISRSWAAFDYLNLRFKLTEIESPVPDSAAARVTWEIKTRQLRTGEIKDFTKTYLVRFTYDAGQWRIQSLDKIEKFAGQEKTS